MSDQITPLHEEALEIAKKINPITPVENEELIVPVAIVPKGFEVESLEDFVDQDKLHHKRIRKTISHDNAQSFCDYLAHYANENTVIEFNRAEGSVTAIFDGNNVNHHGFNEHKSTLKFELTREFKLWRNIENETLTQQQLVEFIDDNCEDIATPSSSEILKMISSLKIESSSESKVELTRSNAGYNISTRNSEGLDENSQLPEKITAGVHMYEHERERLSELWPIVFTVKARVSRHKLTIKLCCPRIHLLERDAFRQEKESILKQLEEMTDFKLLQVYDI